MKIFVFFLPACLVLLTSCEFGTAAAPAPENDPPLTPVISYQEVDKENVDKVL